MPELIITRGLPASGKTTFAREWVAADPLTRTRVNRDDLRWNMFGAYWGLDWSQEKTITVAQHAAVRALLEAGQSVIVDDTHLRVRYARQYADIAHEHGADFRVLDFEVDVETCIKRDAARDRVVGEDVIREMHQKFRRPYPRVTRTERAAPAPPAPYIPDRMKPRAWIVDIDGTFAHMEGRGPYQLDRVGTDRIDETIARLVDTIHNAGAEIIFMSGREDYCRPDTEEWLRRHNVVYAQLLMRASDDKRADYLVKADLFDEHVRHHWYIEGVLDDRNQVVDMWRSMGLQCLQVAPGDF